MRRAAKRQAASLALIAFGVVFALFGSFFVVVFFPVHFLSEWRLSVSGTTSIKDVEAARPLEGTVTEAAATSMSVNETRVWGYDFRYTVAGREYRGRCYTTGRRWSAGDRVAVEHLPHEPRIARIEGARLSEAGAGGGFVVIFPLLGMAMAGVALRSRSRAAWLLEHGRLGEAKVEEVQATNTKVNGRRVFKVTLQLEASGAQRVAAVRSTSSELISLAQQRRESGQPVYILYDPSKPRRLLLPEALLS